MAMKIFGCAKVMLTVSNESGSFVFQPAQVFPPCVGKSRGGGGGGEGLLAEAFQGGCVRYKIWIQGEHEGSEGGGRLRFLRGCIC